MKPLSRLECFNALRLHAFLGKDFKRLNASEVGYAEKFITDHLHLSASDYAAAINRMEFTGFTAEALVRPANRTRIWALLTEAVTLEVQQNKRGDK